jgi:transcriptional regulator with XRE-family HTH domain
VAPSRIGTALKSARERAGWSREALAFHSGVSWSAIAQIESGRRQDVRLSSLLALADALQISVDHLVGSKATVSATPLGHSVLIYESDEEWVAQAATFLAEGLERSECVVAVMAKRQTDLLRDELGDRAGTVDFKDSAEWYRSQTGALNAYRTFVNECLENGAHWIRIVGEAVWAGQSEGEAEAWMRYESMVNVSFASAPATLMCLYDARLASPEVLADARRTHPQVVHGAESDSNPDYGSPEDFLLLPHQRRPTV